MKRHAEIYSSDDRLTAALFCERRVDSRQKMTARQISFFHLPPNGKRQTATPFLFSTMAKKKKTKKTKAQGPPIRNWGEFNKPDPSVYQDQTHVFNPTDPWQRPLAGENGTTRFFYGKYYSYCSNCGWEVITSNGVGGHVTRECKAKSNAKQTNKNFSSGHDDIVASRRLIAQEEAAANAAADVVAVDVDSEEDAGPSGSAAARRDRNKKMDHRKDGSRLRKTKVAKPSGSDGGDEDEQQYWAFDEKGINGDKARMKFGQYKQSTYSQVVAQDPAYCEWVMALVTDDDPSMSKIKMFQRWLIFNKHVFQHDGTYVTTAREDSSEKKATKTKKTAAAKKTTAATTTKKKPAATTTSKKKVATKKKKAATKKSNPKHDDSDSEDEPAATMPSVKKRSANPVRASRPKKRMKCDSDSESDDNTPMFRASSKAKRGNYDSSDSSDEDEKITSMQKENSGNKHSKKSPKKKKSKASTRNAHLEKLQAD